jgi:hypothetical protein
VDSLLIPIDIQIDDEVVTRNVMVYSVTISTTTDGSVYVHRLKEGETTIDDFACAIVNRTVADDGACRDRDATALERGTRDIRQTSG